MDDCIFCKIIKNPLEPRKTFYEDEVFLVIQNIFKSHSGHNLLIIPKVHSDSILYMSDLEYLHLKKVIDTLKTELNLESFYLKANVGLEFQTVFHTHIHLKTGVQIKFSKDV